MRGLLLHPTRPGYCGQLNVHSAARRGNATQRDEARWREDNLRDSRAFKSRMGLPASGLMLGISDHQGLVGLCSL